ncbi:hypothetical protein DICSQDRAFT_105720 [Dichomitus squalens LYAD-421 SS1]|uniref:DUF6534 domain-containing protein n=2 Tax=Dichomitus squalens TaxID=114155 RepID=A0A4Q9MP47_9APHY|nr:uncharacterized protein DICSQDRAFT_105720 [Dichomitus squalens LYAD-421 SS1]EJF61575.1 hypothetical protein DICSQDRAFT_105720 [Dichomitus squalens LYAD-421 SS1]TBU28182.1 hypothetical protein BD311DRAFT_758966 [Dichomitus squalens]
MSDGSYQPPVPKSTVLEIGPILIGALLSWMFFGISIVQLYIYHVSFPHDRRSIQAAVYLIFLLDIFQTIVAASEGWQFLVNGWGRQINLQFPGWTFTALPIVSSLVSLGVQTFYAWRIWQLGRWRFIPISIILTALASAGGAFAIAITFAFTHTIASLHEKRVFEPTIVWLGGAALTDIMIMCSMLYLLYSAKQHTHSFERSGLIVNRLIRLTVETGSACAVSAIVQLGLFLGLKQTNLHLIVALVLSKIYSNTLMTSLNSRATKLFTPRATATSSSYRSRHAQSTSHQFASTTGTGPLAIQITHEVESDRDVADHKARQNWEIELDDVPSSQETGSKDPIRSV